MANTLYNNIPQSDIQKKSSSDGTTKFFDSFYQVPIEINNTTLVAIKGFFETRGWESNAAESVAIIITVQAKKDKLNPFQILDTLKGFTSVQLSALVGEILNYNRFKTSSLGIDSLAVTADEPRRNILL
jgi:hypothetical protein